jgi:hypothetical protein
MSDKTSLARPQDHYMIAAVDRHLSEGGIASFLHAFQEQSIVFLTTFVRGNVVGGLQVEGIDPAEQERIRRFPSRSKSSAPRYEAPARRAPHTRL